ncbi:hypothetical protein [Xylanimonas ulmi]|uniref:hypothetical protein n=1 Tax=Xylanimonas ulmi TaxID=228973 RepID=UPI0026D92F9E
MPLWPSEIGPSCGSARSPRRCTCATILEVGPWGLRQTAWEDLELVGHWRSFLDSPRRYLRHLLD